MGVRRSHACRLFCCLLKVQRHPAILVAAALANCHVGFVAFKLQPTGAFRTPVSPLLHPSAASAASAAAGDADHPGLSIAWGTCGHVFHLDCIQRWLKTRSACPLCNREWEFSKIERIVGGSANAE